jgi:hypothetical protein
VDIWCNCNMDKNWERLDNAFTLFLRQLQHKESVERHCTFSHMLDASQPSTILNEYVYQKNCHLQIYAIC